ncbi:hypothetical protein BGZ81_002985 [Podila clonocystis]|nr:hypothetical protein BGZ81_002985 [Podila clonocystis]
MDQYLEDVWRLLTASANSEQLTPEQHDILQWLKPIPNSTHADGRQMKNRKTETTQAQTTVSSSSTGSVKIRKDQTSAPLSPVLPSISSVASSSSMSPSELTQMEELYHDSAPVHKSASAASLPSLCSSLSSDNGDRDHGLVEKNATPSEGSLPATPDGLQESSRHISEGDDERGHGLAELTTLRGGSTRRHVLDTLEQGDDDLGATKVKRRISLGQLIKSLATVSFHLDPEQRKRDSTAASLSSPPSPANGWEEEDLYIWNTVTTKNAPRAGAAL